jgi:hypothetical protein
MSGEARSITRRHSLDRSRFEPFATCSKRIELPVTLFVKACPFLSTFDRTGSLLPVPAHRLLSPRGFGSGPGVFLPFIELLAQTWFIRVPVTLVYPGYHATFRYHGKAAVRRGDLSTKYVQEPFHWFMLARLKTFLLLNVSPRLLCISS